MFLHHNFCSKSLQKQADICITVSQLVPVDIISRFYQRKHPDFSCYYFFYMRNLTGCRPTWKVLANLLAPRPVQLLLLSSRAAGRLFRNRIRLATYAANISINDQRVCDRSSFTTPTEFLNLTNFRYEVWAVSDFQGLRLLQPGPCQGRE